ncbi:hypothetical protein BVRB_9g222560 [Beta vulgaris subsp. vulgaris]|nr:hypothetical protein BVRB_9g222560 [Beta vulgaris subsp. vulgaris]
MNLTKNLASFICFFLATLALFHVCHAQNSPQDYVNAHNAARAAVGVGNIQWDDQVAAFAQEYANERKGDCALRHSGGGGRYGENLAASTGSSLTGTESVKLWVDEKVDYNYDSNNCASGKVCGHYTQVVWRNSVRLGCARVQCDNGGVFVTCNYDPPGNYIGQKPY